nr:hypothetical protein [Tanacetum cinerariifolium]
PRTPEESEEESIDEEEQDLRLSEEARIQEEEDADELYRDYMDQQMKEAVREAVQIQTDRLQDSLQRENDEFLRNIDENMKKTGGLKDKKKEVSMHQLAVHLKKLPGVKAELPKGLNLDKCLPVSLLLQRNMCRLTCQMEEPPHPVFETAGPTYELMRGSCSSLTELEYHLEEVYKATTDQLDWVNP